MHADCSSRIDDVESWSSILSLCLKTKIIRGISPPAIVMHSEYHSMIRVTQSLIAWYSSLSNSTGLLLLCEVAAKPFHEENDANYDADRDCKANKKLQVLSFRLDLKKPN